MSALYNYKFLISTWHSSLNAIVIIWCLLFSNYCHYRLRLIPYAVRYTETQVWHARTSHVLHFVLVRHKRQNNDNLWGTRTRARLNITENNWISPHAHLSLQMFRQIRSVAPLKRHSCTNGPYISLFDKTYRSLSLVFFYLLLV